MANGQQLAQENKQRFDAWVAERYASKFWPSYINRLHSFPLVHAPLRRGFFLVLSQIFRRGKRTKIRHC